MKSAAALSTLLAATVSAHGGSHVRAALEGVELGQLGPMEVSCADAGHGTGAKVSTVAVDNQATEKIHLVSVLNDGTKKVCASPHTGVSIIGAKRDFLVMEDDMVSYTIVMGDEGREIGEIWRDVNGKWPTLFALRDAPVPPPGSGSGSLPPLPPPVAGALSTPFVVHQTNAPDKNHCEELWVPLTASGKAFWDANSYKFSSMTSGSCPPLYNFLNKKEVDYAGYKGVVYKERGIHTKKSGFMRGSATTPTYLKCGGNSVSFAVTNNVAPSLKLRTCEKAVDPNTGWACNHGTSFKDCQRRIEQGETVELEMDMDVKTILPITFTAEGAVDQVSRCYMEMPPGGWPRGQIMMLDEGWWEQLQASC